RLVLCVSCCGWSAWSCFFFQAEDGIRDRNVTGVQTCALPILMFFKAPPSSDLVGIELGGALKNIIALGAGISDGLGYGDNAKARSEERRVGKEWRGRGWAGA